MEFEKQAVNEGFADLRIGQQPSWVRGFYAGISAGGAGMADEHIILLDIAKTEMNLEEAKAWALLQGHGRNGSLPTASEANLVGANLPFLFDQDSWYWTLSKRKQDSVAKEFRNHSTSTFPATHKHLAFAILRVPVRRSDLENAIEQQAAIDLLGLHAPGKLSFRANGEANSYALLDETGSFLLSLLHNGQQMTVVQEANLRRVVACWNACEGIKTTNLLAMKAPVFLPVKP